jgi:hypothetical protein
VTNLRIALQVAEADLPDVVKTKTTVYVASQRRDDLLAAWDVVRRHFGDHDAPSTLLAQTYIQGGDSGRGGALYGPRPVRGVQRRRPLGLGDGSIHGWRFGAIFHPVDHASAVV